MKRAYRLAALSLAFAALLTPVGAQESDEGFLARISAGLDVIDIGLAAGVGAVYRFPGPGGIGEIAADIFYGPYWETYTEGANTFDYSETLIIVAVRADWLFNYEAGVPGWYQVAGTGVFAGSYSWENYNRTTDYTEGNGYFASGTVINLGLGYVFSRTWEARLEIPVLVFFGEYGEAAAIAIPITAGVLFRPR
ncbi:MAG TPA: hypothetical protein P5117_00770 [Spirochaetia bacterium]|nr:hypothetical protein [Spirochaetales bacterium]HRY80277.1 hypothetical protein [Spirochaetia bacterium]HRZ87988.1 hypothetical protein [Spirochaetia bacterium]